MTSVTKASPPKPRIALGCHQAEGSEVKDSQVKRSIIDALTRPRSIHFINKEERWAALKTPIPPLKKELPPPPSSFSLAQLFPQMTSELLAGARNPKVL